MVYKKKKSSFISLFYVVAVLAMVSSLLAVLVSSKQSYVVDTWENYAAFDFEQKVEADEDGESIVVNYISTPEQLVGAFIVMNNASDEAENGENLSEEYLSQFGIKKASNIFRLKSSIDLAGKTYPSFNLSNSDSVFDGRYYTISNLTINSTFCNVGFIARNSGTIKNLFLKNVNVTNSGVRGKVTRTGAVCGYNTGTITNVVVVSGSVKGNFHDTQQIDNARCVGGICGLNCGTIVNCSNSARVMIGNYLGGIVGRSESGEISNCFNYGRVCEPGENRNIFMGGIAGESYSDIVACENVGEINDTPSDTQWKSVDVLYSCVGGIVGSASANIYSCGNIGNVHGGGFYGKTTETRTCGGGGFTTLETVFDREHYLVVNDPSWRDEWWKYNSSTMGLGGAIKEMSGKISTKVTGGGVSIRNSAVLDTQGVIIDNVASSVKVQLYEPFIYVHPDFGTGIKIKNDYVDIFKNTETTTTYTHYQYADTAYVGGVVGFAVKDSVKIYDSFNLGNVSKKTENEYTNFCDVVRPTTNDYVAIYPLYDASSETENAIIGCYELKSNPISGYGIAKASDYRYVNENTFRSASILSSLGANWDIRDYTNNGDPFPIELFW